MIVPGHRNRRAREDRPIQRGQDPHGIHQAALIEFCDELGYEHSGIFYWWSQIALCRMKDGGWPQAVAEHAALHDVRYVFDQRGREPC